jgi:hypothetical protein
MQATLEEGPEDDNAGGASVVAEEDDAPIGNQCEPGLKRKWTLA